LPNRTPVAPRKQAFVVAGLSIHVLREDRNNILVRVGVHVVYRVTLVERIRNDIRLWHIGNRRRDNIRHVAEVSILGDVELGVGVKLTYSSQMNIATAR
jgi:hypothetical protein